MKIKKTIIILSVLMLFLLIAGVSANDINSTDEIGMTNDVDGIESSTINQGVIAEDSNDLDDSDDKLEYSYEDNLSDEGEFIDVNDAYVYLNQFRNETGVWQWNDDDTTKTIFNTNESNQLKPLARDLGLEETAKIRAKELVEKFDHERPDGTMCFTAFPDGFWVKGENIAWGQTSANEVTEDWKETNDPYSGQGHRRNMLSSDFNCVGIAGYKLNGVIYWVQDFGYSNNINEGEIIYPNTNNNQNINSEKNTKKATKITAKKKTFKAKTKTKKYTITLKAGKKAVKNVKVYLKIGKKTFKATTNKNGKAVFKIKLNKKGTYNSKITFKGNKNFKTTTKKVTIKIK